MADQAQSPLAAERQLMSNILLRRILAGQVERAEWSMRVWIRLGRDPFWAQPVEE